MFPNVQSIILHWYKHADVNEKKNDLKWRFHLTSTKGKRSTMIKRNVQGWNRQMEENVDQTIISIQFELFYSVKQKSDLKLADRHVKTFF